MSEEKSIVYAFPGKKLAFYQSSIFSTEAAPVYEETQGMTLRDWFAGQANVDTHIPKQFAEKIVGRVCPESQTEYLESLKFWAEVEAVLRGIKADAMLAERNKL